MQKLTLTEQILYATVNLTTFADGKQLATGTGFFWATREGPGINYSIVTNKHVLEGASELVVRFHLTAQNAPDTPSKNSQDIALVLAPGAQVDHPQSDVDLIAIPIHGAVTGMTERGTPVFFKALSLSDLPSPQKWAGYDAIEDIIMVGCPRGIFDEVNNFPIARRGITATALNRRYNGRNEFLVDLACFPGSSGSPIFIKQAMHHNARTGNFDFGQETIALVGILYAGPQITHSGEIKLTQRFTFDVQTMMHLGQAISSKAMVLLDDKIREAIRSSPV